MTDKMKLGLVFSTIIVVFIAQAIIGGSVEAEAKSVTTEDLRLRVIAESDDPVDQVVKRVAVFAIEQFMNQHGHTAEILTENLAAINDAVTEVLDEIGVFVDVEVSFGYHYFPMTSGYYASLVVRLGDAAGENWWCFINPGICVVPTANNETTNTAQVETREEIQASLSSRALSFVGRLFGGGEERPVVEGEIDWSLFADER